ncbi:amino acid permease-domain-containing protein, partial [Dimargaris cristalligena]
KLGTFDGVFLPVCSSIWGIILFVRMGFAVGQAGIIGTAGIFLLSYLITMLASLSVSAICTNGVVKGGGPYYMISRCLGPEFGGSIGVVFAFGTLLSGVLNAIAFSEPLVANFGLHHGDLVKLIPEGYWYSFMYNSIALFFCAIVCFLGVQLFAKANTILTGIVFSATFSTLVSFVFKAPFSAPHKHVEFTGFSWQTFQENLWPQFTATAPGQPPESFLTVFSILFPACIGIMAGASMSGDLRKPSKSIPKGTLAGLGTTFTVYILLMLGLGATTTRNSLLRNYNVLQEISIFPPIVALGSLSTAFTSTLTCMILSSKILQAIARDHIIPFFSAFRYGAPKTDEPLVATFVNYLLCQICLLAGNVNAVAPFVTMFYLLTFAIINLACFLLKISSAPNFRPSFHFFKWWTAFLGVVVSFGLMAVADPLIASLSVLLMYLLFIIIHYTAPPKSWGDVTQSLIYHQVRKYLLRLDLRKDHVKYWRPQILLLVHNPRRMYHLIKFCNSLKKGGLFILGHILKGDFQSHLPELRRQQQAWLRFVDVAQIKAFVDLTIADSECTGVRNLILASGLGGMRPNLVIMGLYDLSGYRYRLRYHREEDSDSTFSDDSYDSDLDSMDLPTDQIELETSMTVQDYVCIIEDLLVIKKAVALSYGFTRLHKTCPSPCNSSNSRWWSPFSDHPGKKYIDLWPIQMSVEHPTYAAPDDPLADVGPAGHRTYTTNFDSYALVLQLGTILHMVPYWHDHFVLRVMCFVEHAADVKEEYRRVKSLLETLRIDAELKVLYLDCGQVATYDLIVQGDSSHVEAHALEELYCALDHQ